MVGSETMYCMSNSLDLESANMTSNKKQNRPGAGARAGAEIICLINLTCRQFGGC